MAAVGTVQLGIAMAGEIEAEGEANAAKGKL